MIKENVSKILADVKEVALTAHRDPGEITLVAVTKFVPLEDIQEAINAGIKDIAENRVQEAEKKFPMLLGRHPHVTAHMIGHLQTNKVKDLLKVCSWIQSVDSFKLAQEIEMQATKLNRTVNILLQFNAAQEQQKFGATLEDAYRLTEAISHLPHIFIRGVMGIAPLTEDTGMIRKTFVDLRHIKEAIKKRFASQRMNMDILSMGMSHDYKIAIEEGSTMLRIGSAIFNEPQTYRTK